MSNETEWTIGTGLRRAFMHLVIWSVICGLGWAAVLWVVTPWLNAIPDAGAASSRGRMLLYGLIGLPVAWGMTHLLYSRMVEAAGFSSAILSTAAIVAIVGATVGGVALAGQLRPLADGRDMLMCIVVSFGAGLLVIYEILTD